MEFTIIGSGLTQFLFLYNKNLSATNTHLKSSVISMLSPSFPYDKNSINIEDLPHHIQSDLNKNVIKNIAHINKTSKYLLIDFFEDTHNLINLNNSYITKTWQLINTGILDKIKNYTEINSEEEHYLKLWKENCLIFIKKLKEHYKAEYIVLHKAFLAEEYINKEKKKIKFKNQNYIKKSNLLLEKMYNFFEENYPNINIYEDEKENILSEETHIWGCHPYNLNNQYYKNFSHFINENLALKMDYYKIPFDLKWNFYREDIIINKKIDELNLTIQRNLSECTIAAYGNYYDYIYDLEVKVLPVLDKATKYNLDIIGKFSKDLKIKIGLNFYDEQKKIVYSKILEPNKILETPVSFSTYKIYLRASGIGTCQINYIKIKRNRSNGYLLKKDQVCSENPQVKYILEEYSSNKLIVIFSAFNPSLNVTKYDFLGVMKNIKANKLFILDDLGINGTFYQSPNREDHLQKSIVTLINTICKEKNIPKEYIITLGGSKGASAALYYGLRLNAGNIIAGAPPLYLGIYTKYNYIHQLSFANIVAGGIDQECEEYLDTIIVNQIPNGKDSTIHFLNITNDIHYEGYFKKFSEELNRKNIKYTKIIKQGKGHGDLPLYLADWSKNLTNALLTKKKNIAIIGSCDSRDLFRVYEENYNISPFNIKKYIARSSIISIYSPVIPIKKENIDLKSKFQIDSLYNDLNKNSITELVKDKDNLDYILIDFMEERFDLIKSNHSFATYSWEFRESSLSKDMSYEIIKRNEEMTQLWKEKCLLLINDLKNNFLKNKIILHEAYMVEKYKKNGKFYEFNNKKDIIKINIILKDYYEFFKANFDGINILSYDQEKNYCDSEHIWGCQPYHFNDNYYLELYNKILDI